MRRSRRGRREVSGENCRSLRYEVRFAAVLPMPHCSREDQTRSFGIVAVAAGPVPSLSTEPREAPLSGPEPGVLTPGEAEARSEHGPGLDGSYGKSRLVLWNPERPRLAR